MKNPLIKKTLITIALYIAFISVTVILGELSPGGPCSPGLGAIFILIGAPIFLLVLFLFSLFCYVSGRKEYLPSLLINSVVIFATVLIFYLGFN